jgi:hypothetical protein
MRSALLPGVLLALILLSGCSNKVAPDPICPQTGFIGKTDTVTYLAPGTKDIVVEGAITGFSGECVFKDKKSNVVDVELTLPFKAQLRKAGTALKEKEFSYFIGVVSPDEKILQRTAFTTKITFDNTGAGSSEEEHVIKIPLTSRAEADKYKVIVGFALTRDQYNYNDENKSWEERKK